jgi:protein-L-isoaspartate(D-aspartate) O-methyltransferase
MALRRSSRPIFSKADHLARLRAEGMTNTRLLEAVETIRHDQFVPVEHVHLAWGSAALPLPCGQLMPPPSKTAQLIEALNLSGSEAVLDIGTGSGYQAALLSKLARKVHSVDTFRTLVEAAQTLCGKLELDNVTFAQGDILASSRKQGQGGQALYDRIICDSAFDDLPRDLIDVLASGGIVVAPVFEGEGKATVMRLTKVGSRFERETLFKMHATPIRAGLAESL